MDLVTFGEAMVRLQILRFEGAKDLLHRVTEMITR